MKNRKLMIIPLIAVLLIVYYLLGTGYLKLRQENKALMPQITDATRALAQVPLRPADLEQRLTSAQTSLDAAKNAFPIQLNSTAIINTVLRLADDIGIKAIPLITQPWTTESFGDYHYFVFRFNVALTGTSIQLVSFLEQLENGEIQTLIFENLSVNKENETSVEESVSEGTTRINASLDIAVYAQAPATDLEEKEI